MMNVKRIISTLIIVFGSFAAFAQEPYAIIDQQSFKKASEGFAEAWKAVKAGNKSFDSGNKALYANALEEYEKALKYNSENPELNYRIGVCKLFGQNKAEALANLEKAQNVNSPLLPFYLAQAELLNLKFEQAEKHFDEFLKGRSTELKTLAPQARYLKERCVYGKQLVANPIDIKLENISTINSQYPDYSPVITADESIMYFTSRRNNTTGGNIDKNDGQYYEDIYVSKNVDGQWQTPKQLGQPINTADHDASVAISADGRNMITYTNGDLYISNLTKDGLWTQPEKLPSSINTDLIENSACFSYDGNSIYFIRGRSSDPMKSNGDIYVSKRTKTGWAKAIKLPPNINTKYDEDGVFMLPDGKTLFFSSKGHSSMGGYDIFKTTLNQDGTWTNPINLGYPLNTPDDEVYFVMAADGKTGYYSAAKKDGKGYTDIYKVSFLENQKPSDNQTKNTVVSNMTLVTGLVKDNKTNQPIEAEIEIYDNTTKNLVYSTQTNPDGNYIVSLPDGINYRMAVKSQGYMYYSENFNLSQDSMFAKKRIDIAAQKIENGSTTVLNNLFFEINKFDIRNESESELEEIAQMLQTNSNIKLEISGHTDNTGNAQANLELSENRAKAVVQNLVAKGINQNRLTAVGYGQTKPIAANNTDEGRAKNRRVEIKIIE